MSLNKGNYQFRTLFTPAILEGHANRIRKGETFKGFTLDWTSDTSLFKHPLILTSYYYSQEIPDYRKAHNVDKDVLLYADSGGYSIATKGVKIDPNKVLEWQEFNSNVAFTLDFPPDVGRMGGATKVSRGTSEYVSMEVFKENAYKTFSNNSLFANNRKNPNLLIYNVIHGRNVELFDSWWEINSVFNSPGTFKDSDYTPFQGYAGGVKPARDLMLQALQGAMFIDKGVKENVHFLGVSGITVIPLLVWLSQFINNLSFDATSYAQGALSKKYLYPFDLTKSFSFGKNYKSGSFKCKCNCPVCSQIDDFDMLAKCDSLSGILISLHNLFLMKQYTEALEIALTISEDTFINTIDNFTNIPYDMNPIHRAIDFMKYYFQYGLQESYKTYFKNGDPTITREPLI